MSTVTQMSSVSEQAQTATVSAPDQPAAIDVLTSTQIQTQQIVDDIMSDPVVAMDLNLSDVEADDAPMLVVDAKITRGPVVALVQLPTMMAPPASKPVRSTKLDSSPSAADKRSKVASAPTRNRFPPTSNRSTLYSVRSYEIPPEQRASWTIEYDQCEVVILGDSNLRDAIDMPAPYEIHSLSGGLLEHAAGAIERLEPTHPISVVIQLGINNRTWSEKHNDEAIQSVLHAIRDAHVMNTVSYVFFMGVSYSAKLPAKDRLMIDYINAEMLKQLGRNFYIDPLPPDKVNTRLDDRSFVHYSNQTRSDILALAYRHLRRFNTKRPKGSAAGSSTQA
jgi:hypothetical protein